MAILFGAVHILSSILDPFARLGPVDVLVPFASAYRGTWLGLGVVSGYLYLASVLISWPARRLPRQVWLWLHRLLYVTWLIALVHSIGTGSDVNNRVFLFLNFLAVGSVLIAFIAFRAAEGWRSSPVLWAGAATLAVLVVIALAVWTVDGPMQPGWARASGTPPDLLRSP